MKKRIAYIGLLIFLSMTLLLACGDKEKDTFENAVEEPADQMEDFDCIEGDDEDGQGEDWFAEMESFDLEGNKIDSSIFEEKDLTLINTWASWCGPCVTEIKDLGEIAREYEDEGVGVKGLFVEMGDDPSEPILVGVSDEEKELGRNVLEESNADYQQILVWEGLMETDFRWISAFPTSYFVDSEGRFVGGPIEGARSSKKWKEIIEERLEMVENE